MIIRVKRHNGEVVKAYGRVMRGELVEETDTYFVVRRKNERSTWTYSKANAYYEAVHRQRKN